MKNILLAFFIAFSVSGFSQTKIRITPSATGGGTVTSVGLAMPPAFTVSNSPVTSSGTIGVSMVGTPQQVLMGDGSFSNYSDSLAFRRVGAGLFNTVSHLSNYGGTVASGNDANFIWGARAADNLNSGAKNIILGRAAFKSANNSSSVIAIGDSALTNYNHIGAGQGVIAIGEQALRSYSTGTNSNGIIAIGYRALSSLVNSDANNAGHVAIGYDAGRSLVGPATGVFIGNQVCATCTGTGNTVIGYLAASQATTMSNSVIIGTTTPASATGSHLTLIGVGANTPNAANGSLVAIGQNASAASNSTAVGRDAIAGTSNINAVSSAFGYGANAGGSGTYNVALGSGTNAASSGSSNVAIGDRATILSGTGSNQISIGTGSIRRVVGDLSGSNYRWVFNGTNTSISAVTNGIAFDITGTGGGFRMPQLTTAQRNALSAATNNKITNSELDIDNDYNGTVWTVDDGTIYTQTADYTLANTLTEFSLLGTGSGTTTIPASYLSSGNTIVITVRGYIRANGTSTLNIRFKLGSTTIATTGAQTLVSVGSNQYFEASCIITPRGAPSGSTAVSGQGEFAYYSSATTKNFVSAGTTATVNVSTQTSQVVDVTAQWGTADANNSITSTNSIVEIKN